jgi:hypothetical protein
LAYLGVLLFFVGVFGLVVFAFGDVTPGLRPLAELVIALAPFVAGAMLLKRQAITVGRALEVLGGVLLPIMVLTSFVDGVAFPPDVHGILLVVVLTVLTALIAAAYAWWSGRRERSALRYLVAPIAWLAVAMATLGLGRAVPVGKEVAVPSAAQVAAIAASLVVTLAWARLRPQARLARPTLSVAGPGLFVVALLAVLTWQAQGWPTAPVLISGVLVLTALELLRDRLPVAVVGLAEPLWWALVWPALVSGVGAAPAGAAAAIGFVLITEMAAAARRPVWAVALPAMGAVAALASTGSDARWATIAFSAAAVWALGRRMTPYAVPGAAVALDLAAAILPAFALVALAAASNPPTAVAAGTGLVVLATLPAVRPLMRRDAGDTFWTLWWRTAGTVMALAAATVWTTQLSSGQQWLITTSLVALAMAGIVGPIPGAVRPWPVTTLVTTAWFSACATLEAQNMVRVAVVAVAGLVIVVSAHSPRWGTGRERAAGAKGAEAAGVEAVSVGAAGSLGLAGHVLGVAAVLVATYGRWSLVVAMGLGTAGWVVTTAWDVRDASPVGQALRRLGGWARWLPVVLAAVGLPLTLALALDTAGVLGFDHPWAMAVPAVTAVAYSAATWLRLPDRIGATAAWGAFAAGIVASSVAAERLPQALALGALVVSVVALRPDRRAPVMTWVAWVALAPLAGLWTAQGSPWFDALDWRNAVVLTLVTVGGVLLVGGAATDLRGRRWAPRYLPAHTSTLAPAVVGGGELVGGLALANLLLARDQAGWVTAAVAGVVLATAVLVRVGALAGVATVLGWAAAVLLAGQQIDDHPWIPVVVALALLVIAQLLSMAPAPAPAEARAESQAQAESEAQAGAETKADAKVEAGLTWWARWDLPLLVTAAPVAFTALVAAGNTPRWGATFVAVGLECLAVAVRLRRARALALSVAAVGAALMLAGADNAGSGWLALALLGLSVALTVLAAYTHRSRRLPYQLGGALSALASWQVAAVWLGWTVQQSIDITSVAAGVLAMAAGLLARTSLIERSWLLVWGGMAVVVATLVAGYAELVAGVRLADVTPSWPVAMGLLLVAAALVTSAGPLAQTWMRGLGMAFVTMSVVEALQAAHAATGVQAAVLAVLSATSAVLSLSLFVGQRARTWQRLPLALGVAFAAGAIVVAVGSDSMLMVPGLAAAAIQAAAVGIVLRNTRVQMLSPVLACAAWLVFSSGAMGDNAQWVTVPLGLAILTVVELWRQDRRRRGGRLAATEIVVLELTGVAFLVGAAFVQTVTVAVVYAALAAILGLAVIGWSVLTRVRRRLAAGALIVLASLVLLIAVPLVGLMPAWQGATLWVLIAAVGLVALLVASFLEQGKAAAQKGMSRFSEATAGWE